MKTVKKSVDDFISKGHPSQPGATTERPASPKKSVARFPSRAQIAGQPIKNFHIKIEEDLWHDARSCAGASERSLHDYIVDAIRAQVDRDTGH